MAGHGLSQEPPELLDRFRFLNRTLFDADRRPITRYGDASVTIARQHVPRRKLVNALEDGLWVRDVPEGQVLADRASVECARKVS